MKRSLPEIAAMASKAALGRGCPAGLAEEAGMLAYVAESHGLDGVGAVAKALSGGQCCTAGGPPCAIARAALASDAMQWSGADALCQAAARLAQGDTGSTDSREVDPKAWAVLRRLMRQGLVPETDASRAKGAGPAD